MNKNDKKYNIVLQTLFITLLLISCNGKSKLSARASNSPKKEAVQIDSLSILTKAVSSIKDYHIGYWVKGDIDNDKQDDFVLVMSSDKVYDEPFENTHKIKITILKSINFSKFTILASNDTLVDCSTCANVNKISPLQEISIENGIITIKIMYGFAPKSFWSNAFKYEKGAVYLYTVNQEDFYWNKLDENGDMITEYHEEKTRKDFGWVKFEDYQVE